ncbi:hypothetical protein TNCV_2372451 [Trichonephila clavipes]|nr:hypothetical protein TNCV_2372451 [Trichonephila clavipes]
MLNENRYLRMGARKNRTMNVTLLEQNFSSVTDPTVSSRPKINSTTQDVLRRGIASRHSLQEPSGAENCIHAGVGLTAIGLALTAPCPKCHPPLRLI